MNDMAWSIRAVWPILLALGLASAGGCTSALSTAYLRDAIWDSAGHAAEDEPDTATDTPRTDEPAEPATAQLATEADAERRAAAIDEAVARLARIGRLDAAAKATLVETLQQTAQEDWPVVVAAFAESLESSAAAVSAADALVAAVNDAEPQPRVAAKPDADRPVVPAPEPPALSAAEPVAPVPGDASESTAVDPAGGPAPVPEPPSPPLAGSTTAPEPSAEPSFAVRHACFASRVRAWGDLDRFAESRFTPGQEVIVYLELDHLSASRSPAGHTTCLDATLTLLDARGQAVREWTFEPIAETCPTPRQDYFARYVIRMPESMPPGGCRLAVAVVDTLAGRTASTTLPLEVVPRQVAAR